MEVGTSKIKNPPGFNIEAAPLQRWRRASMPSTPPSNASLGSCHPTSGCRPEIWSLGIYGGLLTRPESFPSTSFRGSNQDPCRISIISWQAHWKQKLQNHVIFWENFKSVTRKDRKDVKGKNKNKKKRGKKYYRKKKGSGNMYKANVLASICYTIQQMYLYLFE